MRGVLFVGALLTALSASCGEEVPARKVCDAGATQWCACPGGLTGVQVCDSDGQGWGACIECGAGLQPDGGGPPPLSAPASDRGAPPAGDGGATLPRPPDSSPSTPPTAAGPKPIMIAAGHYLTYQSQLAGLGPFIVYGWAADPSLNMYDKQLQVLAQIQASEVKKMLMFSSVSTIQAKLGDASHVAQLKSIGIWGIGYNSEGDKTPASEMHNLPQAVMQFAQIATGQAFEAIWGPIRSTAENTPDSAYSQAMSAGLGGIGLQEQKFIEASCVHERVAAVKSISSRLKKLGGQGFHVNVQVMPSRCVNGDAFAARSCGSSGPKFHHCQAFTDQIGEDVDLYAIWASSPTDNSDLAPLIEAIRHR